MADARVFAKTDQFWNKIQATCCRSIGLSFAWALNANIYSKQESIWDPHCVMNFNKKTHSVQFAVAFKTDTEELILQLLI